MVIATQNPIEQEGTYLLPEAQLDRFLFKVVIGYPSRDEERDVVRRHGHRTTMPRLARARTPAGRRSRPLDRDARDRAADPDQRRDPRLHRRPGARDPRAAEHRVRRVAAGPR